MKRISPVSMWLNGKTVDAVFLKLYSINDNLQNSATFYYSLNSENDENLAQGNLTISGEEYQNWGTAQDVNLAAFQWASVQLKLTLVP